MADSTENDTVTTEATTEEQEQDKEVQEEPELQSEEQPQEPEEQPPEPEDQPQQDGGVADAKAKTFEDHNWESDEDWQLLLNRFDFAAVSEVQKKTVIEKKKHKYFREKIDPSHEIPKISKRSSYRPYKQPTSESSQSQSNDNTEQQEQQKPEEERPKSQQEQPKASSQSSQSHTHDHSHNHSHSHSDSSSGSSRSSRSTSSFSLPMLAQFMNYFFCLCQWSILICCVLSFINKGYHYWALRVVIVMHIAAVMQNHGRPQFNAYYAQRVFQDENVMHAIYGLMFYMGPPIIFFLAPIVIRSIQNGCYMTDALLRMKSPSLYSKLHPYFGPVVAKYQDLTNQAATFEVYIGIMLIPMCFFVSGTVIVTIFFWQIMHAKYMFSNPIKLAFTNVNLKLESVFSRVPAVLNIYRKIAGFLYDKVDPAKMQQQAQDAQNGQGLAGGIAGMAKRCNIM